jgi:hypothetical protein
MMDAHPSPTISSFVIRFVVEAVDLQAARPEDPAENNPATTAAVSYRGSVRHIQSEEEINFNTWTDAVTFIRRFVPLVGEQVGTDQP